jgi:hypothetical protein
MASKDTFQKVTYLFDLAYVFLLFLVPRHSYDWMREIDPSISQLPDDPLRDIRLFITFIGLLIVASMHTFHLISSDLSYLCPKNASIMCVLGILWAWKFLV